MQEIDILKKLEQRIYNDCSEKGMCRFIYEMGIRGIYNNMVFKEQMPVLYSLKPKNPYSISPDYWFEPGNWEPRIRIIKEAIAIIEKQ